MRSAKFHPSIRLTTMMTVLLSAIVMVGAEASDKSNPESKKNPIVEHFGDDITFYTSLDGRAMADFSVGSGEPKRKEWKDEDWKEGRWGKALHSSASRIEYPREANANLSGRGSLAIWVRPLDWDSNIDPTYLCFVRIEGGREEDNRQLQISRMGDKKNRNALYLHFAASKSGNTIKLGSTRSWSNEWHLLAANWTADYIEFSVDGGPFSRQAIKEGELPKWNGPAAIFVYGGGSSSEFPYLVDELTILNRPLTDDEVAWIYNSPAK